MSEVLATGPADLEGRWVAPAPVEPPSTRRFREVAAHFGDLIGLNLAGWVALLGAALAAVGAWQLHWHELAVAAVMAALLVIVALLFTVGRPKLEVMLQLRENRVVVGDIAEGALAVRNAGNRRTLPSRLDLPVGEQVASFGVPSLGGAGQHAETFVVPTHRRGVIPLGPAQSVQGDPFALAGRSTRWTEVTELFVHPRTVNLPGRQTGFIHDLEGHPSALLSASDMSFHALREYVPGDDRRHIHWKSSARTGELMVRQFEETRQSRVALALDTAQASYLDTEEFELAVSVIGSAALQCVREENPLAMLTLQETLPAVSALRCLDELSRVEQHGRGSVHELAQSVLRREPGASIVILATGSGSGVTRTRRACNAFDIDTRVIAVMCEVGAELSVRSVVNTTIIRIGDLADLPRAMRRAMQ